MIEEAVDMLDAQEILTRSPDAMATFFADQHQVVPPTLALDKSYAFDAETKIEVSLGYRDQSYWGSSQFVSGQQITVCIPIKGDASLFHCKPLSYITPPPKGKVVDNQLHLAFVYPDGAEADVNADLEEERSRILKMLDFIRADLGGHHEALVRTAADAISKRRALVLEKMRRVNSLNIPIVERGNAPKTYHPPEVRLKISSQLPPPTRNADMPEPALEMAAYDSIISICQSMSLTMERSPDSFSRMDEEDIRMHFLVALNGHFEGAATGETFNKTGKTDIIIRHGDKNIFIAECKFWKGKKQYLATLDQLLSYSSWRDTKTAVLMFVRGTSLSTVIDTIDVESPKHINFLRPLAWRHETGRRFVFHHPSDKSREMFVTLLVFDLTPRPSSAAAS